MAIHSTPKPFLVTYYTKPEFEQNKDSSGYSTRDNQDEYVFAKKVSSSLGKSMTSNVMGYNYLIRIEGRKLCDPRTIFSLPENKVNYIDRVCRGEDNWVKVPQTSFENYLKFLQTDSDQWYKAAIQASK